MMMMPRDRTTTTRVRHAERDQKQDLSPRDQASVRDHIQCRVCRLAWCVQHHVSSRSTILLFYHGSRHSLDIQMEPYINHSV